MVHALEHPHPDGKRIAGYTVAIAFNALLLMLILVPMQGPEGFRIAVDSPPRIIWYTPEPKTPPVAPVVPTLPQPPATPVRPDRSQVVEPPAPVFVDDGTIAAPAVEPTIVATTEAPSIAPIAAPLPGVRLEYLRAPPPDYPRASARMRSEGTVLLEMEEA